MATGRPRHLALLAGLAALAPIGCAQSGPLASRYTMVGSLKASVSQLEVENQKLRKDVGELRAENTRLDTQVVQERDANGELTARLDDAKELIRRQGGDVQALGIPSRTFEDDGIPPPASRPPVRRSKSGRTPPSVTIPRPDPVDPFGTSEEGRGFDSSSNLRGRDLSPLDREDDGRWLPVARGIGTPIRQ